MRYKEMRNFQIAFLYWRDPPVERHANRGELQNIEQGIMNTEEPSIFGIPYSMIRYPIPYNPQY
jgi:hypothetical protein